MAEGFFKAELSLLTFLVVNERKHYYPESLLRYFCTFAQINF